MANKWVDPLSCPNRDEFERAYMQSYMKAKAFEEIIKMLANAAGTIESYSKQLSKDKNYGI